MNELDRDRRDLAIGVLLVFALGLAETIYHHRDAIGRFFVAFPGVAYAIVVVCALAVLLLAWGTAVRSRES